MSIRQPTQNTQDEASSSDSDESLSDLFSRLATVEVPRIADKQIPSGRKTLNSLRKAQSFTKQSAVKTPGHEVTPTASRSVAHKKSSTDYDALGRVASDELSKEHLKPHVRGPAPLHLSCEEDANKHDRQSEASPRTLARGDLSTRLATPGQQRQTEQFTPGPDDDLFWDKEFVDEWTEENSPDDLAMSPVPMTLPKARRKDTGEKPKSNRELRKAFEKEKHALATSFIRELDEKMTEGKLAEMTASAGGIRIVWTNKLNTTAGRATWKKEKAQPRPGEDYGGDAPSYRHNACIVLAEKVVDDQERLLNVIAHEFCHLATFMMDGVTSRPHGAEFKRWATMCSSKFADRAIKVTTKHSYDIDFKYVWECSSCGVEFKRHSKSIDPSKHRCGACKSELKQTKPALRTAGTKTSEYQVFVKEQMKVVRLENPSSPQKDIMKMVATKWTQQTVKAVEGAMSKGRSTLKATSSLVDLTDDLVRLNISSTIVGG